MDVRAPLSAPGATGAAVRAACRRGALRGHSSGLAPGFAQANLVIVPADAALEFLTFCVRNPAPCPLLEVLDAGATEASCTAPGSDVRTDLPRYRVWRDGVLAEEVADIRHMWPDAEPGAGAPVPAADARRNWVAFLLGCSFSFEEALLDAGLPVRHLELEAEGGGGGGDADGGGSCAGACDRATAAAAAASAVAVEGAGAAAPASASAPAPAASKPHSISPLAVNPRNVPMYRCGAVDAVRAGRFAGPLVVSMRPMRDAAQARAAAAITARIRWTSCTSWSLRSKVTERFQTSLNVLTGGSASLA